MASRLGLRRPRAPRPTVSFVVVLALCATVAFACNGSDAGPPQAVESTLRTLRQGSVVGTLAENGAAVWRGIPYARPPVGPLRWRAPQPPDSWDGVREALRHGPLCMQLGGPLSGSDDDEPIGDEDCLFLNVYAPADDPDGLPVMVWIHGGGNTVGSADVYDGSVLAVSERVVVVTLNYRLGLFGWFSHPALRHGIESAADRSGNFGTLDLVRALEWVRDEIHRFGGDPARVTVFGESAGGVDVYSLLLSPRATGLFHRAIVQSGALFTTPIEVAENAVDDEPPGSENSSTEVLLALLQADGRAADRAEARAVAKGMDENATAVFLREQPAADLLRAVGSGFGGMYRSPQLFEDGTILPAGPPLEQLARGAWNRVPVITGTNRDAQKLFAAFTSPHVFRVFRLPLYVRDATRYEVETGYPSLMWKATGVDEPAAAMSTAEPGSVFAYRFDWDELPKLLFMDWGRTIGAGHGVEIPFVFGKLGLFGRPRMLVDGDRRPAAEALARTMNAYWAEFARSGDPGRGTEGDLPAWRPWTNDGDAPNLMLLDTPADGGVRMIRERLAPGVVLDRLAGDPRIEGDTARCEVLAELVRWEQGVDEGDYASFSDGLCRDHPL